MTYSDILGLIARISDRATLIETPEGWIAFYPNDIHKHTYPDLHTGFTHGFCFTKWNVSKNTKRNVMHVEVDPDDYSILHFKY
jgi:hypothetical protein